MRIHLTGASGTGTSTLGMALAARLRCAQVESDAALWELTDPPFTRLRARADRQSWLRGQLPPEGSAEDRCWVLSGSMVGWGEALIPRLTLVVFLTLEPEARMARIRAREAARYGSRIAPGGDMAENSAAFLAWAAAYDTAGPEQRSRILHEAWLRDLPCPVLRLDSNAPVEHLVHAVLARQPD
jgi:adenylate kinase family enzyme